MKENHTFKSEIRRVVRKVSAVALCALIVTAWTEGGTTTPAPATASEAKEAAVKRHKAAEQGDEDAKKALQQP